MCYFFGRRNQIWHQSLGRRKNRRRRRGTSQQQWTNQAWWYITSFALWKSVLGSISTITKISSFQFPWTGSGFSSFFTQKTTRFFATTKEIGSLLGQCVAKTWCTKSSTSQTILLSSITICRVSSRCEKSWFTGLGRLQQSISSRCASCWTRTTTTWSSCPRSSRNVVKAATNWRCVLLCQVWEDVQYSSRFGSPC